jgi:hypothetical protein
VPFDPGSIRALGDPLIASVTEGFDLVAVQERVALRDIVDVGGRADHGVHQPRLGIGADVRLHAEVVVVARPGLMHLGITLAIRVLGRTRRGDQRRIDQRPGMRTWFFRSAILSEPP